MGMQCVLRQIPAPWLEIMQSEPDVVRKIIDTETRANIEAMMKNMPPGESIKTNFQISNLLEELSSEVAEIPDFAEHNLPSLDLDKSWHGIHYLLTGEVWTANHPLGKVIMAGKEIGNPDDFGYGCPRYLTPAEVQELATALSAIPAEVLIQRYNVEEMKQAGIYAMGSDEQDDIEYISFYYQKLVAYYQDASARGNAMLICVL